MHDYEKVTIMRSLCAGMPIGYGNNIPGESNSFLVVFSFFEKTTYCCRARRLSVRLSVRPSVCPSVCPSVEIISFRGNSLPNRPIELKIGLNVREGVVHVRKA